METSRLSLKLKNVCQEFPPYKRPPAVPSFLKRESFVKEDKVVSRCK